MNTQNNVVVPSALLDNTIQFVEVSSMMAKRAYDEVQVHRQAQKQASDLAGPVLDFLLKAGIVAPNQKEAAAAMLGSHATTLSLLKSAGEKIVELKGIVKKAGDGELGEPAGEGSGPAQAGDYNSLTSCFVGEKTAKLKESDKALLKLIGK